MRKLAFLSPAVWSYSVSLPHVGGEPQAQVSMDDQGVVDVDEEGKFLLTT